MKIESVAIKYSDTDDVLWHELFVNDQLLGTINSDEDGPLGYDLLYGIAKKLADMANIEITWIE